MESNTETTPTKVDVLCGTGYDATHHPGNLKFKQVVAKHYEAYAKANTKKDKMTASRIILDEVLAGGARFLKKDLTTQQWYTADPRVGKDKISHCLRDLKKAKEHEDETNKAEPQKSFDVEVGSTSLSNPPQVTSLSSAAMQDLQQVQPHHQLHQVHQQQAQMMMNPAAAMMMNPGLSYPQMTTTNGLHPVFLNAGALGATATTAAAPMMMQPAGYPPGAMMVIPNHQMMMNPFLSAAGAAAAQHHQHPSMYVQQAYSLSQQLAAGQQQQAAANAGLAAAAEQQQQQQLQAALGQLLAAQQSQQQPGVVAMHQQQAGILLPQMQHHHNANLTSTATTPVDAAFAGLADTTRSHLVSASQFTTVAGAGVVVEDQTAAGALSSSAGSLPQLQQSAVAALSPSDVAGHHAMMAMFQPSTAAEDRITSTSAISSPQHISSGENIGDGDTTNATQDGRGRNSSALDGTWPAQLDDADDGDSSSSPGSNSSESHRRKRQRRTLPDGGAKLSDTADGAEDGDESAPQILLSTSNLDIDLSSYGMHGV